MNKKHEMFRKIIKMEFLWAILKRLKMNKINVFG